MLDSGGHSIAWKPQVINRSVEAHSLSFQINLMYSKLAREEEARLSNWCECSEQRWVTGSRLIRQSCLCLATNRAECFSLGGIVSLFYRGDQTDRDSFGGFGGGKGRWWEHCRQWNGFKVVCGGLGSVQGVMADPFVTWLDSLRCCSRTSLESWGSYEKGSLHSKLGLGNWHNFQGALHCV